MGRYMGRSISLLSITYAVATRDPKKYQAAPMNTPTPSLSNHYQLVESFRTHLTRLGYGKSSCQMLPECVREFLAFAGQNLENIQADAILAFYEHLQQRPHKRSAGGLSPRYIHHFMYSLRVFFAWMLESRQLSVNPISSLSFEQPSGPERQILTLAEVHTLYHVCKNLKERAILSLYYGCGLRRSEGENMDLRDVHFRNNLLYVRSGKYGKRRAVPMSENVKADLWEYVLNDRYSKGAETALISNRLGKRMTGESCNYHLKAILSRTEIDKPITLHSLRHSIATHLLENGLSLDYVRTFLGHQNLETTQLYTQINPNQVWKINDTKPI